MINVKVYVSPDESKANDMGSMMIEGMKYKCMGVTLIVRVDQCMFEMARETGRLGILTDHVTEILRSEYVKKIENMRKRNEINFAEADYRIKYVRVVPDIMSFSLEENPVYKGYQKLIMQYAVYVPCLK